MFKKYSNVRISFFLKHCLDSRRIDIRFYENGSSNIHTAAFFAFSRFEQLAKMKRLKRIAADGQSRDSIPSRVGSGVWMQLVRS